MIGQTNMAFFKTMCSRKESKAPLVKVAKYMERLSLYVFNFYHYQWCCPTEWNLIQSHFSPFVAVTHHKLSTEKEDSEFCHIKLIEYTNCLVG